MGLSRFGLPLLTREMLQRAQRRSTYIVRMAAAAGLTAIAMVVLPEQWWRRGQYQNAFAFLGGGRELLEAVVNTLFIGIYGLLPLLSCGAITEERERNSFDLLLLTRLGPWTIVFEKILSRLVLMATLVLLSLPILAFAYSLGGVDDWMLLATAWLLFLASFHVIALSILASTFCRSTIAAYLLTCVLGILVILTPLLIDEFGIMRISNEEVMFPPMIFEGMARFWNLSVLNLIEFTLPLILVSLLTVALSRFFLTRALALHGAGRTKWILSRLDACLCWCLSFVRRSPQTLSSGRPLPDDRPLLWKEQFSGMLSSVRYRRYVSTVATLLVLYGCWLVTRERRIADEELALVYFLTTGFVAMAVVVRSATLFSNERSRQTLNLLLTTPMSNRQLLLDKVGGINRMIAVFAVPLLAMLLCDGLIKELLWDGMYRSQWGTYSGYGHSFWFELISQLTTIWIYLQILVWLPVLVGLKVRKPIAAMVVSLATVMVWVIVPLFVTLILIELSGSRANRDNPVIMLLLTSPGPYLLLSHFGNLRELWASPPVLFAINTLIYGGAILGLRALCFRKVGKLLQRGDSPA